MEEVLPSSFTFCFCPRSNLTRSKNRHGLEKKSKFFSDETSASFWTQKKSKGTSVDQRSSTGFFLTPKKSDGFLGSETFDL